jgi:ribosomal protein S18 acetylase RimI-like enzyme
MAFEQIIIRKIKKKDIIAIAAIHKDAYPPDHFSTKFSLRMLEKYYYEFLKESQFSLLVTDEFNYVSGFLIVDYFDNIKKARRYFILKNIISIIMVLIKNPQHLLLIITNILNKLISKSNLKSKAEMKLLSIAVSKKKQNRSFGKLLLDTCEDQLKKNNINLYGLTVRKSNDQALRFYIKNGFVEEYSNSQTISLIKTIF